MDPTSLLQQLSDAFNGIMRTLESSERTCASLTAQIGSIENELASVGLHGTVPLRNAGPRNARQAAKDAQKAAEALLAENQLRLSSCEDALQKREERIRAAGEEVCRDRAALAVDLAQRTELLDASRVRLHPLTIDSDPHPPVSPPAKRARVDTQALESPTPPEVTASAGSAPVPAPPRAAKPGGQIEAAYSKEKLDKLPHKPIYVDNSDEEGSILCKDSSVPRKGLRVPDIILTTWLEQSLLHSPHASIDSTQMLTLKSSYRDQMPWRCSFSAALHNECGHFSLGNNPCSVSGGTEYGGASKHLPSSRSVTLASVQKMVLAYPRCPTLVTGV
ncbi:hypothetical protein C8J57DRAFT_1229875 [Mycena rebaudengoi]|nr:hypothetical protein C8J57DRAFT_1229875 [Mycena rebaudengoi]